MISMTLDELVYQLEPGTRVKVFDNKGFIGFGTYLGKETVVVTDDDGNYLTEFITPKIQLDDGKIVYGYEVWWIPKELADNAEITASGRVIYKDPKECDSHEQD